MKIAIAGVGMVGGALQRWFEKHTDHELRLFDPGKKLDDDFTGVDCVFCCVPVPPGEGGQDQSILAKAVNRAKKYTDLVFIRSTVLPGTNDLMGTTACPEFLTARRADEDMEKLPILMGPCDLAEKIFPGKPIIQITNTEAEMAKFAHNCFGAMKVNYFNMIYELCNVMSADYKSVLDAVMLTGFIGREHTRVPGPDGRKGFGGVCFPENVEAMRQFVNKMCLHKHTKFWGNIQALNREYRGPE